MRLPASAPSSTSSSGRPSSSKDPGPDGRFEYHANWNRCRTAGAVLAHRLLAVLLAMTGAGALRRRLRSATASARSVRPRSPPLSRPRTDSRADAGTDARWRGGCTGVEQPGGGGEPEIIGRVPDAGPSMALTFDMGGRLDPALTIMAFLVANQVCATLFPTGAMSETPPGRRSWPWSPRTRSCSRWATTRCTTATCATAGWARRPTRRATSTAGGTDEVRRRGADRCRRHHCEAGTGQDPAPYWRPPHEGVHPGRARHRGRGWWLHEDDHVDPRHDRLATDRRWRADGRADGHHRRDPGRRRLDRAHAPGRLRDPRRVRDPWSPRCAIEACC